MTTWNYSISMEYVREDHPRVELYPRTDSGVLRLSAHGLWDGIGTYTSPVIDLGEIYTFSGVYWESIESAQAVIDTVAGGNKTLEVRYHDTTGPSKNSHGNTWQDGESPHPTDPIFGDNGLPWIKVYNGVPIEGVEVRYIQWRATFRALK